MVGASLFSQPCLCIQPPLKSLPKIRSSTSVNFHLPISPLLAHKIIFTIPANIPFHYTSAVFHFPIFAYNHPSNLHQNIFPTSVISPIQVYQGTRELGSLVKPDTVLISPFFLKVWTAITGLIITDSLSPRLRKLMPWR